MKIFFRTLLIVVSFVLFTTQAAADDQKLPIIDGKEVVAMVNNEPITAEEYNTVIISIAHGEKNAKPGSKKIDYAGILDRLITERLLLIEAGNIGIDELPEVTKMLEDYADKALMNTLVNEAMKNVTADQEKVEKLFKEAVSEFKLTAVLFKNEIDAKATVEALTAGGEFDDLAKKAMEDGSAKKILPSKYLNNRDLLPGVAAIASTMEIGSFSPVIAFQEDFGVLRLDDIRYPENPAIRSKVNRAVTIAEKEIAVEDYTKSLIEKHVEIDDALLENIDYDASMEDFNALMKDERIVAKVKNGKKVTVAELSAAIKNTYYHGVEDPQKSKELNSKKNEILTDLLQKIVLKDEAVRQGLDKTDKYKIDLQKYRKSLIFKTFVQKVIAPGITFTEDELKVYYEENAESYASPEMMRIEGLVFDDRDKAQEAIDKLKKGTDIKWLRANATGQVLAETDGILNFNGRIFNPKALLPEVGKALEGASSGDYRLYESSKGYFYALYIQNVFPSEPYPYEKVKKKIADKVYNEKAFSALDDWTDQLKKHYKVEIYLKKL